MPTYTQTSSCTPLLDLRLDPLGGRLQRDTVPFVFLLLLEFAEYGYLCATPNIGLVPLVQRD